MHPNLGPGPSRIKTAELIYWLPFNISLQGRTILGAILVVFPQKIGNLGWVGINYPNLLKGSLPL